MFRKIILVMVMVFMTTLVLSGCSESIDKNQKIMNHSTLPGHTFTRYTTSSYDNKTTITRSRNGVIVYKDNSVYDNRKSYSSTSDVGYGPGAIKFGPNGN